MVQCGAADKNFKQPQGLIICHQNLVHNVKGSSTKRKSSNGLQGTTFFRHHVEPRVKLYVPREASFPNPLKYI